jgi:hypothetical protein
VELPPATQFINLSLIEALTVIDGQDLAGVFAFVPEASAPAALADYLLRHPKALKKFLKRGESDLRQAGGINEWDKHVYIYMVAIHVSGVLDEKNRLSSAQTKRVLSLSNAPGMPLVDLTMRRQR